jgi:hypothetical protein
MYIGRNKGLAQEISVFFQHGTTPRKFKKGQCHKIFTSVFFHKKNSTPTLELYVFVNFKLSQKFGNFFVSQGQKIS